MFAVIETGGKQYLVQEGDVIYVEKLDIEEGSQIVMDKVLLVSSEDALAVGTPTVDTATVSAKILGHGKKKKVLIFKYRPKDGYRKKQGHRQPYTRIQIEKITA